MPDIKGRVSTTTNISGKVVGATGLNGNIDSSINERIYRDYNKLRNRPSINGVLLENDKSFEELGRDDIKNSRIKEIVDAQYDLIFGGI